jgi:hypothetical protein
MVNKSIKLTKREALITSNFWTQLSTTCGDGNQDSGFRQAHTFGVGKPVYSNPTPSKLMNHQW